MRRVVYDVYTRAFQSKKHKLIIRYLRKFKGVEFPTAASYTQFIEDLKKNVQAWDEQFPHNNPSKVYQYGDYVSVVVCNSTESEIAIIKTCVIEATYEERNFTNI